MTCPVGRPSVSSWMLPDSHRRSAQGKRFEDDARSQRRPKKVPAPLFADGEDGGIWIAATISEHPRNCPRIRSVQRGGCPLAFIGPGSCTTTSNQTKRVPGPTVLILRIMPKMGDPESRTALAPDQAQPECCACSSPHTRPESRHHSRASVGPEGRVDLLDLDAVAGGGRTIEDKQPDVTELTAGSREFPVSAICLPFRPRCSGYELLTLAFARAGERRQDQPRCSR